MKYLLLYVSIPPNHSLTRPTDGIDGGRPITTPGSVPRQLTPPGPIEIFGETQSCVILGALYHVAGQSLGAAADLAWVCGNWEKKKPISVFRLNGQTNKQITGQGARVDVRAGEVAFDTYYVETCISIPL